MIVDVGGATCEQARAVVTAPAGVVAADVEAVLRAQGRAPLQPPGARRRPSSALGAG